MDVFAHLFHEKRESKLEEYKKLNMTKIKSKKSELLVIL